MFGRNRDSIAGIELEVQNLFSQHPAAEYDEYGVISLPVSAVPDILEQNPGESLLSDEEMHRFLNVLEASGGRVRVDTVVQLYAIKTKDSAVEDEDESALQLSPERDSPTSHPTNQESEEYPPPPLPPKGSDSDIADSPFDAKNRQRSRPPLAPPSSFGTKKPLPVHGRRRSDAGAYPLSDSESPAPPSGRRTSRSRAPSNPTSPSPHNVHFSDFSPEPHSPYTSRPPSRSQSRNGQYRFQNEHPLPASSSIFSPAQRPVSPHGEDPQDDEDDEYDYTARLGRIDGKSNSLVPEDRYESLTRINDELSRKLVDAERTLASKLEASDQELAELEGRLEEMRQELAQKNREEKELRAKDRTNVAQIQALEGEVSRLQKNLDGSRHAFTTLHKQYQDQIAESERYRDALRQKDDEIKELLRLTSRTTQDAEQRDQVRLATETRVAQLEEELIEMRKAEGNLDLQKAENLLLKETIDRLRFELDEMTNNATTGSLSLPPSHMASISKSLGAELSRMEKGKPDLEEGDGTAADRQSSGSGEGEEEIQTIIRRTRRRGGRRNLDVSVEEKAQIYVDTPSQCEPTDVPESSSAPTNDVSKDEGSKEKIKEVTINSHNTENPIYLDEPPSYASTQPAPMSSPSVDERAALIKEVLREWHPSDRALLEAIPAGVSRGTLDDWENLKKEIGIECRVMDTVLAASAVYPDRSHRPKREHRGNRFYNIYNTYIYGDNGPSAQLYSVFMFGGLAIGLLLAAQPFMPASYMTPGMPTYVDRVSWQAANSLGPAGVGFDQSAGRTSLGFLRMLVGGAQIMAGRLRPPLAMPPT